MHVAAFAQKYVEQVQKSFNGDVYRDGMHHAKNRGNKVIPLAILSRILAQSCVTPPYIIKAKGLRMIVLYSILDSIAKGITLFPRFFAWCIPSLHLHSFIFALVYM